jgi:peptidoglycan hydrolase CwlO-like protein
VRRLALARRARGLSALGTACLVLSMTPAAQADTTGDAEAKARVVLAQVQQLQKQVAAAERRYDAVLGGVAGSVNDAILTDRTSEAVQAQAAQATAQLDDRVRGLYMSGGPLALYATLLSSGDITDLQTRVTLVQSVVDGDRALVDADTKVVAQARARASAAAREEHRQIATERDVAQVATRVLTLLAHEQQLLDQANAQVAHLKELDAARAAAAAQNADFNSITSSRLQSLEVLPPSPLYLSLYHQASRTCPGLSWTVLAAIGQVESGHGRNPSTSYAGAMGPMQFLPSTFQHYAVDGNHDGVLDIMDPYDAIFTAAAYLCANGAGNGPSGLYNAVWHYNHADWYVQMVLTLSKKYATWSA